MARWRWRSQDADLAARFALLIAGIAALTAARAVSFIASEPDRSEPPFPPLLWAFHAADMLFLPAANRLPGVTPILYIQCAALALALLCFYMAARARVPRPLLRFPRSLTVGALALTALLVPLTVQGTLPYRLVAGTAEHYGNDAIAATDCAVHLLLEGRNPYASFRSAPCLKRALRERAAVKSTPLRACAFPGRPPLPVRAGARRPVRAGAGAGPSVRVRVVLQLPRDRDSGTCHTRGAWAQR